MTAIHSIPTNHKMAWRGGDFTKDDIAFDLTARHAAALEDLALRTGKMDIADIVPADCRHPALDADLERVFEDIPVSGHSIDEVSRMFWALGAHLGRGVSQSALGDVLGYVRDETPPGGEEAARGYTSRRELSLHCDLAQIVGLMCLRQAKSGGESQYAAGHAIHHEIAATRPDLLPILYRGFPYHRRGEDAADAPCITPYDIPVFSVTDGQMSVFMVREIMNAAFRELKRPFSREEIEAIDLFRETARRLQFETRLEAGEATFLNNYTVMHARS
jgi:hypothetical protein